MKYHKQLFNHDPERGVYGDCHRTAVACLLDLRPEEVPHVFDNGSSAVQAHHAMDEWLRSTRGLRQVHVIWDGSIELIDVLNSIENCTEGLHYILGGQSRNGTDHSVIAACGEIIHDPSLSDSGIVGPCSDGYWWITFLGLAT